MNPWPAGSWKTLLGLNLGPESGPTAKAEARGNMTCRHVRPEVARA